jgi:F-type H+-transporting ATPase subunit gamma
VLRQQQSVLRADPSSAPALIVVGHKLHTLLEGDARVVALVDGASVVEEVDAVLNQLAAEIVSLQSKHGAMEVFCLFRSGEDGVMTQRLLPPFADLTRSQSDDSVAPILNLSPANFQIDLTDQYLFAALHAILYTSLMMENHQRVTHLEAAVRHLDDQSQDLARQCNGLRQEEIIEEIEVILLNAASLDGEVGQ